MTELKYRYDGETRTIQTADRRVGYAPRVAHRHAAHDAADRFEDVRAADVTVVRMGAPHDRYDETGGVPL